MDAAMAAKILHLPRFGVTSVPETSDEKNPSRVNVITI